MKNDILDILRDVGAEDFRAIEAAIKTVKKEKYKARKEPADLQIKSVKRRGHLCEPAGKDRRMVSPWIGKSYAVIGLPRLSRVGRSESTIKA